MNAQRTHENSIRDTESITVELEEVQKSNEKLQEELELVYQALNEKNRELLLLERKVALGESENAIMHSHISSVLSENSRFNHSNRSEVINDRKSSDFDLSKRIKVMASNLTGTICD